MISHSGSIAGFGSNFARIENDDVCIVLLSNKSGSTFDLMHLTDKLLAVLYHQPYSVPVKRKPVAIKRDILKKYIGTYIIDEMNLTIEITAGDGVLIVQPSRDGHPGGTSFLHALNDIHFYDERDEEVEATFVNDATGKVNGINILQMGSTKYAKKIK